MRKTRPISLRYKDGRPYRRFKSYLELGKWLLSYHGQRGFSSSNASSKAPVVCRTMLGQLRVTRTVARRASDAYVAWLMGKSRIQPIH